MRRILAIVSTMLLAFGMSAGPANAAVLDLTCTASYSVSYDPPLTNTAGNTTATVNSEYAPCVSLTQPDVTSSPLQTAMFPVPGASCTDLLYSGTATQTFAWNTGQTSTVDATYTATIAGAVYNIITTGTVTAGLFQGSSWTVTLTGPSTDITLCLLGQGSVSGVQTVGTLVIT